MYHVFIEARKLEKKGMIVMTPKQEKEWAKGILDNVNEFGYDMFMQAYVEFKGELIGLAEGHTYIDKPFARKVTSLFESLVWMDNYRKGTITKEEFLKKLEEKGKAQAQKEYDVRLKRIENKFNPKPKRRKKKSKVTNK